MANSAALMMVMMMLMMIQCASTHLQVINQRMAGFRKKHFLKQLNPAIFIGLRFLLHFRVFFYLNEQWWKMAVKTACA